MQPAQGLAKYRCILHNEWCIMTCKGHKQSRRSKVVADIFQIQVLTLLVAEASFQSPWYNRNSIHILFTSSWNNFFLLQGTAACFGGEACRGMNKLLFVQVITPKQKWHVCCKAAFHIEKLLIVVNGKCHFFFFFFFGCCCHTTLFFWNNMTVWALDFFTGGEWIVSSSQWDKMWEQKCHKSRVAQLYIFTVDEANDQIAEVYTGSHWCDNVTWHEDVFLPSLLLSNVSFILLHMKIDDFCCSGVI